MKKYLLATLILAAGAVSAQADNSFNGAYGGVQASYQKGDMKGLPLGFEGGAIGAFGGYGHTIDDWYVGGEISLDFNRVDGASNDAKMDKKNSIGVTARAGYLITPEILAYGLVGLEQAKFKTFTNAGSTSDYLVGYRGGIGAEAFVSDQVSVRSEVSFTDWESKGGKEWRASLGAAYHF